MITPYVTKIQETSLPFTVWFGALIVIGVTILNLALAIIEKNKLINELNDKINETEKAKSELAGTLAEIKEQYYVSKVTQQQAAATSPAQPAIYKSHNKGFADQHPDIIGMQVYEVIKSKQYLDVTYSYQVLNQETYKKHDHPLTSPSDSISISERLIDDLKRDYASNSLLKFITTQVKRIDQLCQPGTTPNEKLIIAHLVVLRVATTIQGQFSNTSLEPSFANHKLVTSISVKRRTGVVEGILLNDVLGDITSYYFKKQDGAESKKDRWYAAVKKTNRNEVHLLTFNKKLPYQKVLNLTNAYNESLKAHHLM
ncbi:hypothetical protein ACFYU8_17970 [Brevibacillus sp. NPDC003359]|uniref:hypothetical protein n=1 Tax=unclassified Brevibacillus TaxID=2684853 RepID=UPI00368074DA